MPVNPLLAALVSPTAETFEASYGWGIARGNNDAILVIRQKAGAKAHLNPVGKAGVLGMGLLGIAAGTAVVSGAAALIGPKIVPRASRQDLAEAAALAYAAPSMAILLASLFLLPKSVALLTADPRHDISLSMK